MEAAVEKRWSVTVSDLQAWSYTKLDCQTTLCARNTSFFRPRTTVFLAGPHAVCIRLEWRTDWIDCERSSFTPCSWLRRRNERKKSKKKEKKKKKKSSVASAASSVALHGLPEADHCEQKIEYRTRNSEASCSIPPRDNLLQVSHLKIASNMISFEVSIISRINWYLDRSTGLCRVSAWSDMSIRTFDIRRAV